ncbi:hypothetical protein C3L29_033870 [Pseudomonas sp. MWU12-2534b]|nr:hypothetical protein C3L29_033870 [Pseudomonas sp. MWU12-2534b]
MALAIGVILAVWSAASIDERFAFIEASVAVQGTDVRLTPGEHHPLIEFVTKGGERVSFPESFVTVMVGDTVPVRDDPARPLASTSVDTFTNLWLESIISIAFLYGGLKVETLLRMPWGGRDRVCGGHRSDARIDAETADAKKPPRGRL